MLRLKPSDMVEQRKYNHLMLAYETMLEVARADWPIDFPVDQIMHRTGVILKPEGIEAVLMVERYRNMEVNS